MKKILLGTTALVGASFMATAAFAAPEVKVGGFMDFQVGITSQDIDNFGPSPGGFGNVTNDRGYGFTNDSEVIVKASDKLDNGLSWAVKIELEAGADDSNDNADEVTLTLSGSWGQMWFGNDDGPVDTMKIGAKTAVRDAGTGGTGGNFRRWTGWNTASSFLHDNDTDIADSSDSIKIAYVTPRIAGFQAAVSFSPTGSDTAQNRVSDGATATLGDGTISTSAQENWIEAGLGYDQTFDQVRVRVSGVYSHADAQNSSLTTSGYEDVRAWGVGAAVTFGGFTVSGGYADDGKSATIKTFSNKDVSSYSLGIGYNMGAWDFGLSGYRAKAGAGARSLGYTGDDKLDVISAGVTYELGAGLTVYTEATWFDTKQAAANRAASTSNSGVTLVSGVAVEF